MNARHTEFFGPDYARGPHLSHRIETAAVQLAAALAQLRAPLSRGDNDLRAHAAFIRELADRLAPDWAALVSMDVGAESGNTIATSISAVTGTYSLLECWLADSPGGGVTTTSPASVTWSAGTLLQTVVANRHYRVLTPGTGAVNVSVNYSGARVWYWAVSRHARVYYSSQLYFT